MGKKRITILGTESEDQTKTKRSVQREQKKIREGKTAKVPGLGGGERVADTTEESLRELEIIEKKQAESEGGLIEKAKKAKKAKVRSKAYRAVKSKINSDQSYALVDAVKLLREVSYSPKNETVELHVNLKDRLSSMEVHLPHSSGKSRRVAIADEQTLTKIEAGQIDFDVLIASPADMPKLVKFAKILGPRGLMPNPKTGTVSDNPSLAAKKLAAASSIFIKTEKSAPVIHTVVGKLSMSDKQLEENIAAVSAILAGKATKSVLKSTMSPAIKLTL